MLYACGSSFCCLYHQSPASQAAAGVSRSHFSTGELLPIGFKADTYQQLFENNIVSALYQLKAIAVTEDVFQIMQVYSTVVALMFQSDFPGSMEEHAETLRTTIVDLNTRLHDWKGFQPTAQCHRLLHFPDQLLEERQFQGMSCQSVC